ncbi:DUF5681 domain-containing protein [Sphingomonas qomolangmaensis]|uniref:DUF5681 domain-containing protein n=1 Tax=Sphingomonas qomolangmaensis TaxID=2918765 RepID=A0ABY5LCD6_9SPHN|nr:DUF5681 domain-containing protein [Sphingomonas qomolangmaensis]UUL84082.1 DUF5681 domain-containing protein [Sphingomonas qomolangmaensis]
MSGSVARGGNGRFAKGQSGNPEGARTRRRGELMNLEEINRTILRVFTSRTQMMIAGKPQDVTLLEANVWGLASGKPSNRLASKDVIELTKDAASFLEELERREKRRERGY